MQIDRQTDGQTAFCLYIVDSYQQMYLLYHAGKYRRQLAGLVSTYNIVSTVYTHGSLLTLCTVAIWSPLYLSTLTVSYLHLPSLLYVSLYLVSFLPNQYPPMIMHTSVLASPLPIVCHMHVYIFCWLMHVVQFSYLLSLPYQHGLLQTYLILVSSAYLVSHSYLSTLPLMCMPSLLQLHVQL